MECCRDGCPSGGFSQLHRGTLELWQSDHRVLGSWWPRPFSPDCSVELGRVLVVPNFFHLRMIEALCSWTFNAADIFWYSSPHLSRHSMDNSFDLMAWFLLWHALSTVKPYLDRCVPFQIMSNQLNLPQVDSNCRNIKDNQWKQDAPELNFESHRVCHYRVLCVDCGLGI